MEEDAPPGVPEWVVTYGDMMSLLLTFFIMLVSLSEIVAEQKYRAVLTALDQRLGFITAPVAPPGHQFPGNSMTESEHERLGAQSPEDTGNGGVKPVSVQGDERRIKVTDEGIPQQVGSFLTFQPVRKSAEGENKFQLTGDSEEELIRIVSELRGKPNKIEIRSHVAADGHSQAPDSEPITDSISRSYEQGHAVFSLLESWDINIDRIRITAAGNALTAKRDVDTNVPSERIEIYITDVFSSEYVVGAKKR